MKTEFPASTDGNIKLMNERFALIEHPDFTLLVDKSAEIKDCYYSVGTSGFWHTDKAHANIWNGKTFKIISYTPKTGKLLDLPLLPPQEDVQQKLINFFLREIRKEVDRWDEINPTERNYFIHQMINEFEKEYLDNKAKAERGYSLQEVIEWTEWLGEMGWHKERDKPEWHHDDETGMFSDTEKLVNHYLSKPQQFIPEMERTRYPKGDDGWEDVYRPKTEVIEGKTYLVGRYENL